MAIRKKLLVSALILTISSSLLTGCNQNTKETSNNATTTTSTELAYNDLFKEEPECFKGSDWLLTEDE